MAPSANIGTHGQRRSSLACVTCRRKKVRCPGEKPACSSCVRLNQSCTYTSAPRTSRSGRSEERLANLEEKLDLLIKGNLQSQINREIRPLSENPENSEKPYSATPASATDLKDGTSPISSLKSSFECSKPDSWPSTIADAIILYFKHCHRQPIWCFDRDDVRNHAMLPEELVYSILSLASHFSLTRDKSEPYSNYAKKLIMFRIANASVELPTIESLCLLSYSSFIDGDVHLGQFYVSLAIQLCRSAMLDLYSAYTVEDPLIERKKRLFWSLQVLEQSYGRQTGLLSVPTEVWRPSYFSISGDRRIQSESEPEQKGKKDILPLPTDNLGCSTPNERGIWNTSLHLGWVWSRVRKYVSDCAQNILKEPWRHDSMYALVLSDFMETEHTVPMCHRYDSVKFYERNSEELEINRDYWAPWLREQFLHNSIQTVLNHPFLYIVGAQHNPNLATPNTFWRRSSELALLHSTWTVRLIDMIWEKKMALYDPFFGHAAAIAATVHLYYCCAANARLRYKSIADFAKCRKFLKGFSSFSPACEALSRSLDKMTVIAVGSETVNADDCMPSKIYLSVPLMWDILQFNSTPDTQQISTGLLDQSLAPTSNYLGTDEHPTLEVLVATLPEVTVDTADGGLGRPMLSIRAPLASGSESSRNMVSNEAYDGSATDSLTFNTTPWLWADPSESGNVYESDYRNLPLAIGNAEGAAWWDVGSLTGTTLSYM